MKKYVQIVLVVALIITNESLIAQTNFVDKYKVKVEQINMSIEAKLAEMKVVLSIPKEEKAVIESDKKEVLNESPIYYLPVKGKISSGYGYRKDPFTNKQSFHNGIDIAVPLGKAVYSTTDGVVNDVGRDIISGNYIIISHNEGYISIYGHLSKVLLKVGDVVSSKNIIGYSGNTGRSTGPHLHFEIRKNGKSINPFSIIH